MFCPNETQRPIGALTNADSRRDIYFKLRPLAPTADTQRAAIQTRAIQIARNRERLRQFAGTVREAVGRTVPLASGHHLIEATQRLERANQHAPGHSLAIRNHIQAFVHAVDEVHVRTAGRTEYHFGPRSKAARGVGRQVVEPEIGFRLDQHPGRFAV